MPRSGITPADQEIADELRRLSKPVLLLANKCEGRLAESQAAEAWSLGLGEPLPVSGEHGDGIPDLLLALRPLLRQPAPPPALTSPGIGRAADEEAQPPRPLRLAVIGRPNAGKSR